MRPNARSSQDAKEVAAVELTRFVKIAKTSSTNNRTLQRSSGPIEGARNQHPIGQSAGVRLSIRFEENESVAIPIKIEV